MASYTNIVPFILQAEGGLSKSKADSASVDPVPDGSGNHTNKGITWTTFKSFLVALGIGDLSTAIQRFYSMSQSDWGVIFKNGYWDKIQGDKINSQGAADTLVDWAWGAGPGTAVKKLQQFLTGVPEISSYVDEKGIAHQYLKSGWLKYNGAPDPQLSVDGGMGNATLSALNAATRINEKKFVSDFSDYKKAWYLSLPNQNANYAGWADRLDRLKTFALSSKGTAIIGTGLLIAGFLTFFLIRSIANR